MGVVLNVLASSSRSQHFQDRGAILMKARDVMTCHAISVSPDLPVKAVANTLVKNGISAVPVIGREGRFAELCPRVT